MRRESLVGLFVVMLGCTPAAKEPPAPELPPMPKASASTAPAPSPSPPPAAGIVVTEPSQCEAAVDKEVTVIGILQRTKIPTVAGVDVEEVSALSGKKVVAKGVLKKRVEPPPAKGAPIAAGRGPGTYYYLVSPNGQGLAKPVLYDE